MSDRESWPDPAGRPRYADGSEIPVDPVPAEGTVAPGEGQVDDYEQQPSYATEPVAQPTEEVAAPATEPANWSTAPGWEVAGIAASAPYTPAAPSQAGYSTADYTTTSDPTATAPQPQPVAAGYQTGVVQPIGSGTGGISGRTVAIAAAVGLVAGLLGGAVSYGVAERLQATGPATAGIDLPQPSADAPPLKEGTVAAIAAATLPTVVSLAVEGRGQAATGSGFILNSDGYVLTNNHVIAPAANGGKITVVFYNQESVTGEIVGLSQSYDIGVVKISANRLQPTPLGNSDAVRVGDPVVAIGSPLGLSGTVTTGIVSALNRPVTAGGRGEESFISALQTDAAINPGNSGGPLLDAEGRVIGINSAIATVASANEAGSIGLGFAIPINQAKRIAEEIIATGSSSTPIIGVTLDTTYTGDGAKVESISPDGPSSGTNLKPGDIIVGVNGEPVNDANELVVAIRTQRPGDTVTLEIKGKGDVRVKLGSADE